MFFWRQHNKAWFKNHLTWKNIQFYIVLQKKVNENMQQLQGDLNRFMQVVKKISDETSGNR